MMDGSPATPVGRKSPVLAAASAEELRCVEILHKDPRDRTPEEVDILYVWVSQLNCSFFDDYSESITKDLCKCMKYESIPANNTLFRQGDDSNKLYIIVHGSVSVWIASHENSHYRLVVPKLKQLQNQNPLEMDLTPSLARMQIEKRVTAAPAKRDEQDDDVHGDANEEEEEEDQLPARFKSRVVSKPGSPPKEAKPRALGFQPKAQQEEIFVGILRAGGPTTSFGELGLLSDSKRSATIRTELQDSQFLTIEKEDFNRVLKARTHEILTEKCAILKRFKMLSAIPDDHLVNLALHLKKRVLAPSQLLFKEGSPATHIYLLVRGSVAGIKRKQQTEDVNRRHTLRNAAAEYEQDRTFVGGDIIGAQALSEQQEHYQYTARALADCELFQITSEDFLQRVRQHVVERIMSQGDITLDQAESKEAPALGTSPNQT